MGRTERDGYIVKIDFVGDSITPVYRFRLYKPRKYWFPKYIHEERLHTREIQTMDKAVDKVINRHKAAMALWEGFE